jgi:hypothetical protein
MLERSGGGESKSFLKLLHESIRVQGIKEIDITG